MLNFAHEKKYKCYTVCRLNIAQLAASRVFKFMYPNCQKLSVVNTLVTNKFAVMLS